MFTHVRRAIAPTATQQHPLTRARAHIELASPILNIFVNTWLSEIV